MNIIFNKKEKVKELPNAKIFRIKSGVFLNPKRKIKDTAYIDVSSNPTEIILDLEILKDCAYDYLPQIAYNIGMSVSEIKDLLANYDPEIVETKEKTKESILKRKEMYEIKIEKLGGTGKLGEDYPLVLQYKEILRTLENFNSGENINIPKSPFLFRVSIPFWRLQANSYCGDIYVSKENFTKGILMFNKSFGRFPINLLPEHKSLAEEYHYDFIKMLEQIDMTERDFFFACPEYGNKSLNIGHFCTVCLTNKVRKNQRKVSKAVDYFKKVNRKKTKLKLKLRELKIKNVKKLDTVRKGGCQ